MDPVITSDFEDKILIAMGSLMASSIVMAVIAIITFLIKESA